MKKFSKIILVVALIASIILCGYGLIKASKPNTLTFNDKAVYAMKYTDFDAYVDKLNEVHYADDLTLLDESIPQMVIYQDKDEISYVMQLNPDNAIEKLNELKYSSEYEVIDSYIPMVVYYY